MACVIVPVAEAIAVSVILKKMKRREACAASDSLSWTRKLEWLHKALWGGAFLLFIEHVWHGEITFRPPFLTALENPGQIGAMLREIAAVGTSMALLITGIWLVAALTVGRRPGSESAQSAPMR